MSSNDEDVILKRLLIEGDSGGDDKRICNLLKTFCKWSSQMESLTESDATDSYNKMVLQLRQVDSAVHKIDLIKAMNQEEHRLYEESCKAISNDINLATEEITSCKEELENAKVIRHNRQQYDSLAGVILNHPERQGTIDAIAKLKKEVADLECQKAELEKKLERTKKTFGLFNFSLAQVKELVKSPADFDLPSNEEIAMET